ncbi:Rap GTPase-activating protein [Entamoeba marina]
MYRSNTISVDWKTAFTGSKSIPESYDSSILKQNISSLEQENFFIFSLSFPPSGEQFMSGIVDPSNQQTSYNIVYSKPFEIDPTVFVYKISHSGESKIMTDGVIHKTKYGFTIQMRSPLEQGTTFYWFSYVRVRCFEHFNEMKELFSGVTITLKEIEQPIINYVKKYGANNCDVDGKTLVHYLSRLNYPDLLRWVINKGGSVNCMDKYRFTPLHTALSGKEVFPNIITLLIENGADITNKNIMLRTPLYYLCRQQNLKDYLHLLGLFLPKGADNTKYVNELGNKNESALNGLCSGSLCIEALRILCSEGANVNNQTITQDFPLYCAIKKRDIEAVKILIRFGARLDMIFYEKTLQEISQEYNFLKQYLDVLNNRFIDDRLSHTEITEMQNQFPSKDFPVEQWLSVVAMDKPLLILTVSLPRGYHIENSSTCCTHKHEELTFFNIHDSSSCIKYYEKYFEWKKHSNYILPLQTDLLIVSITNLSHRKSVTTPRLFEDISKLPPRKVIIRNKRNDTRKIYPGNTTDHQILKEIGFTGKVATPITGRMIYNSLLKFENFFTYNRYKFGVLYGSKGQTTENQFYMNQDGSPYFNQFLKLLGNEIELQGYRGYCGGLDTTCNQNGKYTYTTQFSNNHIECIFHVSTLIPFDSTNEYQPERKRFIGNDLVVLIFKEFDGEYEPIDISSFSSQTNNVFIVVGYDLRQPHSNTPHYIINCVVRQETPPIPPFITEDHYLHDLSLREFLLAKLINGERATHETSTYRGKRLTVRQNQLESISLNASIVN